MDNWLSKLVKLSLDISLVALVVTVRFVASAEAIVRFNVAKDIF